MTNEQQQVREWMQAFGQECPEKPVIPNLEVRKLRAKLILEEALETVRALGFDALEADPDLTIIEVEDWTCQGLAEIADGCEDLKVVTEGTLVACGLIDLIDHTYEWVAGNGETVASKSKSTTDPLFNEVMRSNNSKMWRLAEIAEKFGSPADHKRTLTNNSVLYETAEGFLIQEISFDKWLVKDKDGKVIKSPSYSPANLQPIIDEMSGK